MSFLFVVVRSGIASRPEAEGPAGATWQLGWVPFRGHRNDTVRLRRAGWRGRQRSKAAPAKRNECRHKRGRSVGLNASGTVSRLSLG